MVEAAAGLGAVEEFVVVGEELLLAGHAEFVSDCSSCCLRGLNRAKRGKKRKESSGARERLTRIGGMIRLRNPRSRCETWETWEIWVCSVEA